MAATWTSTMTVTDLATKRIRVTATRTDGEDIRTYSCDTKIDSSNITASNTSIVDAIWNAFQSDLKKQTDDTTLISDLPTTLDTLLNNKEKA